MTKLDKVIKGLEGVYRCVSTVTYTCGECPYQDNRVECKRRVLRDAIALLKEQEAHLLDISEIYTADDLDVWIEEKGDYTVHPLMLIETEMTDKRQAAFFFPMFVRPVKAYGKTWRCWTARPTDEQRKAVKWE